MSLASLIHGKSRPTRFATATPATFATQEQEKGRTVASVATVTVAKSQQGQTAILSTMRDVDLPEPENDTRHFRWLIHFPDRDPVETTCLPEPTHAEVLAMYPDATAAEPMPERTRIKASPEQKAELRALVASAGVAYGFTPTEQQEALDLALWDVDAALQSYRAMLAEQNIILDGDDRRRCTDCANLSQSGKCKAWESVGAIRGYAPVQDQPKRCEGYAPGPDDPDRRGGLERWPGVGPSKV